MIGGPSSRLSLGVGGKERVVCKKEGVNGSVRDIVEVLENLIDVTARFCLERAKYGLFGPE